MPGSSTMAKMVEKVDGREGSTRLGVPEEEEAAGEGAMEKATGALALAGLGTAILLPAGAATGAGPGDGAIEKATGALARGGLGTAILLPAGAGAGDEAEPAAADAPCSGSEEVSVKETGRLASGGGVAARLLEGSGRGEAARPFPGLGPGTGTEGAAEGRAAGGAAGGAAEMEAEEEAAAAEEGAPTREAAPKIENPFSASLAGAADEEGAGAREGPRAPAAAAAKSKKPLFLMAVAILL